MFVLIIFYFVIIIITVLKAIHLVSRQGALTTKTEK